MVTNGTPGTRKIKSNSVRAKAELNKIQKLSQQYELKFKEETSEIPHLEHNCAGTGTLRTVDHKHLKNSEMWHRGKSEISWNDNTKKYYKESSRKCTSYMQLN